MLSPDRSRASGCSTSPGRVRARRASGSSRISAPRPWRCRALSAAGRSRRSGPTAPTSIATSARSRSTSPPTTAAAVFFRLVERADVVVENFRPGVKYRLGIEPDAVWAVNRRVVYASISGFGQSGPYADRPGVDQIAEGLGGLMSVTGPPGSGPWRVGIAVSDTAAGTLLTQGVLAALHRARSHRSGAVGAHLAARGDGELHGLPGRALAHRRRGAGTGGQSAPDDGADGCVPDGRRLPERLRPARLRRVLRAPRGTRAR